MGTNRTSPVGLATAVGLCRCVESAVSVASAIDPGRARTWANWTLPAGIVRAVRQVSVLKFTWAETYPATLLCEDGLGMCLATSVLAMRFASARGLRS